jgi:integrase
VPIPRFLVAELRDHIAGKEPDELVFNGVREAGHCALRSSAPASTAIDIPELHPHELRHSAASLVTSMIIFLPVLRAFQGGQALP